MTAKKLNAHFGKNGWEMGIANEAAPSNVGMFYTASHLIKRSRSDNLENMISR